MKTIFTSLTLALSLSVAGTLSASMQGDLPRYAAPEYLQETIKEQETLVNELISLTSQTPGNELTSEQSLALRKRLVDNLSELTSLYKLEPEEDFRLEDYHRASFQLRAFLAEWKALDAKNKIDRNLFSEAIKSAEIAIKSRYEAAETADLLGWHEEAPRQRGNARWPEHLLSQAKEALRHEITSLEAMSERIRAQVETLGEQGAYTTQGMLARKNLIKLMKLTEEKLGQTGDIQQAQELIFTKLTTEAELGAIQAKRFLNLGLSRQALLAAEISIKKREEASRQASILGWPQDAILQQEFTSWPNVLAERARTQIQSK